MCGYSFVGALADTIIGPNVTLVVTNSEELGSSLLQLKDGTTLVFPEGDASVAGFNEYTLTGGTSVGTPYTSPYGTFTRIIDSTYWADRKISDTYTEYIEALAKPPRDMGVPPMKHGQDARATPARKGFCRIF